MITWGISKGWVCNIWRFKKESDWIAALLHSHSWACHIKLMLHTNLTPSFTFTIGSFEDVSGQTRFLRNMAATTHPSSTYIPVYKYELLFSTLELRLQLTQGEDRATPRINSSQGHTDKDKLPYGQFRVSSSFHMYLLESTQTLR